MSSFSKQTLKDGVNNGLVTRHFIKKKKVKQFIEAVEELA